MKCFGYDKDKRRKKILCKIFLLDDTQILHEIQVRQGIVLNTCRQFHADRQFTQTLIIRSSCAAPILKTLFRSRSSRDFTDQSVAAVHGARESCDERFACLAAQCVGRVMQITNYVGDATIITYSMQFLFM